MQERIAGIFYLGGDIVAHSSTRSNFFLVLYVVYVSARMGNILPQDVTGAPRFMTFRPARLFGMQTRMSFEDSCVRARNRTCS